MFTPLVNRLALTNNANPCFYVADKNNNTIDNTINSNSVAVADNNNYHRFYDDNTDHDFNSLLYPSSINDGDNQFDHPIVNDNSYEMKEGLNFPSISMDVSSFSSIKVNDREFISDPNPISSFSSATIMINDHDRSSSSHQMDALINDYVNDNVKLNRNDDN